MYYNNRDVRLEEMPTPAIGPGELLVKVLACGICGSDVMEWYRLPKAPRVLGHEIAGEIVAVGEGMGQYEKGQRVFVSHHVPCNTCYYCQRGHHTVCDTLRQTNFDPGGFAEFIRVPAINVDLGVFPLPEEVSSEEATFIEPLGCVVRGQRLARMQPGQSVLVIGSGVAGLLHIQLARALGAERVVAADMVERRLEAARRFGADVVINAKEDLPARLRQVNEGRLADLAITCTGAEAAIAQAMRSVERGGTILIFAPTAPGETIPLPLHDLWADGITLTNSYGASPQDIPVALELIRSRRLRPGEMVSHRLGLGETGRGFKLVAEAKNCLKVIIEPQR
jgi:L-iditol 2-dehydrogenase